MTQYYCVDEYGDAELDGQASSSSHFVITIQDAVRAAIANDYNGATSSISR